MYFGTEQNVFCYYNGQNKWTNLTVETHILQPYQVCNCLRIALQKAGRSDGIREVIKFPSTTTSQSSYIPLEIMKI